MILPALRSIIALAVLACGGSAWSQSVTVFAAASLTDAMNEILKAYGTRPGAGVRGTYASSATLARQIESGAPADIFVSADEEWMDYLDRRSLIEPGTRVSRLGNRLVLVAPASAPLRVDLRKGVDIRALLGAGGRIATGDPASVPVGRYAQQALTWLGQWSMLEARIARADNVRVALAYVERGEAPLGIVYATDAAISKDVRIVGEFPAESHAAISYPLAIVAKRGTAAVREFHTYLLGAESASVFQRYGFSVR